eukprot:scaffold85449_cov65-Cyclotella_meneghiniana.AAC.1
MAQQGTTRHNKAQQGTTGTTRHNNSATRAIFFSHDCHKAHILLWYRSGMVPCMQCHRTGHSYGTPKT